MAAETLSVEHFRNILGNETKNLNKLCEQWSKLLEASGGGCLSDNNNSQQNNKQYLEQNEEESDQEEIFGAIRSTIGQAKLLMSQRFKQFSDLIDDCEFNKGQHPTRLDDLLGFWEMISYQVEDVVKKFKSLEAAHSL